MEILGRIVDIIAEKVVPVSVIIENGVIKSVDILPDATIPLPYILPGFIDAHVHIESSLLIPSEFARLAVVHGTVATVSDPHEIANVCGLPGVEFMIRNGRTVPFHFNFGAPSCVPATQFETAGATLDAAKVEQLLASDDIKYLSEMMNFPGVLAKDPEVMAKIAAAQRLGKPVDGHAPGLRGQQAADYIAAGISTDHEAFTIEEALDKLKYGMKILIREGSAARNFDALIPLLNDYPDQIMFCSDDKHPDSLVAGHINTLCARAVAKGIDVFKVLKAACLNPVLHYKLDSGLVRPGDSANLVLVEDLKHFQVKQTWIKGQLVAQNGVSHIASTHLVTTSVPNGSTHSGGASAAQPVSPVAAAPAPTSSGTLLSAEPINNFKATPRTVADFAYPLDKWGEQENVEQVYVIEALDGQLITNRLVVPVADTLPRDGRLHANPGKDLLKIVVVNRYIHAPVAKSFIRNFGLRRGAIASSVAHDSHNIVAVGVDDESICRAINLVIAQKGGLSCVDPGAGSGLAAAPGTTPTSAAPANAPAPGFIPISDITGEPIPSMAPASGAELVLPLAVAGLMSLDDGYQVAEAYTALDHKAKAMGSTLGAPFMTLSFMALLVIPHLKLSDMGLFDGDKFALL
ncbi:MAG TPA: adenine deaminase C-terminal domain-containing protein [Puia sp.]|jgi:adenine deaminase